MKIDVSSFDGHLHIEDFLDWHAIENVFDYMEIPDEKRVKLIIYKLRGGASTWWE